MNELEQILTNTLAQASLTQAEQKTLSQYIPSLVMGFAPPIIDFECFANQSHSADLESTYQYYVSKGHNFNDLVKVLKLLVQVANNHRNKSTIYKLVVCDDFFGANNQCERCGRQTNTYTGSWFNTQMICPQCDLLEHEHPLIEKAKKVEREAMTNGDFNFAGIGLPKDLEDISRIASDLDVPQLRFQKP